MSVDTGQVGAWILAEAGGGQKANRVGRATGPTFLYLALIK